MDLIKILSINLGQDYLKVMKILDRFGLDVTASARQLVLTSYLLLGFSPCLVFAYLFVIVRPLYDI